jgi:hypothetical protein
MTLVNEGWRQAVVAAVLTFAKSLYSLRSDVWTKHTEVFLLSTASNHHNHIFAPIDISLPETLPMIYLVSVSEAAVLLIWTSVLNCFKAHSIWLTPMVSCCNLQSNSCRYASARRCHPWPPRLKNVVSSWHTQSFWFLPAEVTGCAFNAYSKSAARGRLKRM